MGRATLNTSPSTLVYSIADALRRQRGLSIEPALVRVFLSTRLEACEPAYRLRSGSVSPDDTHHDPSRSPPHNATAGSRAV